MKRERQQDPQARMRARGGDRGFSFVEILVTVVLLGTVVLSIIVATQTSIIASRVNRESARVESALLNAAERIERADRDVFRCKLDGLVNAATQYSFGVDASEADAYYSVDQWYLDPVLGWTNEACPDRNGNGIFGVDAAGNEDVLDFYDGLVQKVVITMISPDNGLTRTLEVVKGDV